MRMFCASVYSYEASPDRGVTRVFIRGRGQLWSFPWWERQRAPQVIKVLGLTKVASPSPIALTSWALVACSALSLSLPPSLPLTQQYKVSLCILHSIKSKYKVKQSFFRNLISCSVVVGNFAGWYCILELLGKQL